MIIGAHAIIYSQSAEADRAFLQDVIGLPSVDVGRGWLIFGLPPAEVAVHPSDRNDIHELYLMCEDVRAFMAGLAGRGINCDPVVDQGWGLMTQVTLPGGGRLGVYQPRHGRPPAMKVARPAPHRKAPAPRRKAPARRKPAPKPAPSRKKKAGKKRR